MDVLVTCKNEGPIKNEGTRVVTTLFQLYVYGNFSNHSNAASSGVYCSILLNFEPIHKNMALPVKNEADPIKNKGCRVVTTLFFSVTYKSEEDPSKDEGTRVVTFSPF